MRSLLLVAWIAVFPVYAFGQDKENAATSSEPRIAASMTSSSLTEWPRVCSSASSTSATPILDREEPILNRVGDEIPEPAKNELAE
jgi:hypothetical protein